MKVLRRPEPQHSNSVICLGSELATPTEYFNTKYVQYGENDDYPDYLLSLFRNSAIHGSLIKGIAQLIGGDGIYDANTNQSLDVNGLVKTGNGDTLDKFVRLTSFEFKLNGYAYWEVIKRGFTIEINLIRAVDVRNLTHKRGTKPEGFVYSNPTSSSQVRNFQTGKILPAFDGKATHSILYLTSDDTSLDSYCAPDYCGGINDIELDIESKKHKLNSIKNGFFPSALVNVVDPQTKLSVESKKKFERQFTDKFAGSGGSRLIFNYATNKDMITTMSTFEPPNIVEFFSTLSPEVVQSVLVAHRVTSPLIFGVKLEGTSGLGSNTDEMKTGYSIFTETVVKPSQNIIIEAFEKVYKMIGANVKPAIKQYKPAILEIDEQTTDAGVTGEIKPEMHSQIIEGLKKVGLKLSDYQADGWDIDDSIKMEIESKPLEPSFLDTDTYRVRYRYVGPRDNKNRTFCADVLDLDLIYRKEDIDAMSLRGENKEFGRYDIFQYKGNINCRHRWEKVILKKMKSGETKQLVTTPKIRSWFDSSIFNIIKTKAK